MNERIKQFAEQAGLIADGEHWFSAIQETDVRSIDLERFAELVRQNERQALAQPEQEPVAYIDHVSGKPKFIDGYVVQTNYDISLYTVPPKREWVGLHLDDIPETYVGDRSFLHGARWAEAKLKEKNT